MTSYLAKSFRLPSPPPRALHRICALLCALSLGLTAPHSVFAQLSKEDRARAEAKAMEATIEYKAGNHEKAARFFLEAFAISQAPALMYNAARAYQKGGMPSKAIVVFEQYLELEDVTDEGRDEARKHLKALQEQVAARGSVKSEPKVEPKTEPKVEPKTEPKVEPKTDPKANPGAAPAPAVPPVGGLTAPAPAGPDWLTWGLIGGGGLSLLIGLGTMASAAGDMQEANEMDFAVADAKKTYNERADAAESSHNAGIFFTLLGLGAGGYGAYRYFAAQQTPAPAAAPPATASWFSSPLVAPARDGSMWIGWTLGGHFR